MSGAALNNHHFRYELLSAPKKYMHNINGVVATMFTDQELLHVWHNRLGHAPFAKLKHVSCIPNTVLQCQSNFYLTCPLEKFTKLPYNLSTHHSAKPFDLIHIDISGPYKAVTHKKYRYFLTIVDDHARATCTYLLQYKFDALAALKIFYKMIAIQFGTCIKMIRSDNAIEFESTPCKQFFAEHGILHQTTYVDKPQQNRQVDRKHKHLLEVSRAIRCQASLPLKYWGDCVLSTVHIINQLPTPVLQNKTAYEMLLHKQPSYDHLRVIGCLAYASNPTRDGDKSQPKGVPCVFLGYPPRQKAINC